MKNRQLNGGFFKASVLLSIFLVSLILISFSVKDSAAGTPNMNDMCMDAENIFDGTTLYDSTGAASSAPPFTCGSGGSDLWYIYSPTCTGIVDITTNGSSYNTTIEAIAGTDCGDLTTVIDCNDDGRSSLQSRIQAEVNMNESFFLRVGGFNGASGSGQVNIGCEEPIENDTCETSLEAFNGTTPFNNEFALPFSPPSDPPFPTGCIFADSGASRDVWYDYRATCTGDVSFSTCSPRTRFDSVIELFDTDDCGSLAGNSAACNDDDGSCPFSGLQSTVKYSVQEGENYRVRVATWGSGFGGNANLVITPGAGCNESACFFKRNATNKITVRNGTPNQNVVMVWGFKKGNASLNGTACDGLPLGIANAKKIARIRMNSSGNKQAKVRIPSTSENSGYIQLVDISTCTAGVVREAKFTAGAIPPGTGCVYTISDQQNMMMSIDAGPYQLPKEFAPPAAEEEPKK